jgi:HPt (histidine-containing phosphotransfer) domain-containing protein
MPEMDGVAATAEIKKLLGKNCPPIIAMTAYSMKDDAEKFLGQGMDDYVSKPVKAHLLHAVMKRWLQEEAEEIFTVESATAAIAPVAEPPVSVITTTLPTTAPVVAQSAIAIPAPEESPEIHIDDAIIDQLRQLGGDDFAKQLYIEFAEETEPLLEEAGQEIAAKHYTQILGTLHQLKGTSSTLGLIPIAEMAKKLEHDIKKQKLSNVDQDFTLLLNHYSNFKKIYPKKFTQN